MKPSGALRLIHPPLRLLALVAGLVMLPGAVHGQPSGTPDATRLEISRAGLEDMLTHYEEESLSPALSPQLQQEAAATAESIRLRLRDGDFRPGDEIELYVEGEPTLQGTFIVDTNRALTLPVFGSLPLHGVLRSELQEAIRYRLSTYLINPVVTARSSIRLMISGNVSQPGIYVVPTTQLLSAVIMESGRPGAQADLRAMRIERGDSIIWRREQLENAVALGYSVDQLGLRSGDHIFIPPMEEQRSLARIGSMLATGIPAFLIALTSLLAVF